jgi:rhamnosyltransferase
VTQHRDQQRGEEPAGDSVCAVVVTCHPQCDVLNEVLASVSPQVGRVLVVDNGSPPETLRRLRELRADEQFECLELGDNLGLGAAHNIGIDRARRCGSSFVLLLDHDSIPSPDMVERLLAGYREASRDDQVAAVGPAYLDPRTGRFGPFIRFGTFWNRRIPSRTDCQSVRRPVRTDFLITSGTLIPLSVLDAVGGMNEGLFVDYVDTEWSLRAAALGYRLYGVPDAVMRHTIGDHVRRRLGFRIHAYSPLRLYYNIRNRFLLSRKPHAPPGAIVRDVLHAARLFFIYGLLIGPRWDNLRMLCRGLRDAWAGRVGRCDVAHLPEEWQAVLNRVKRAGRESSRKAA